MRPQLSPAWYEQERLSVDSIERAVLRLDLRVEDDAVYEIVHSVSTPNIEDLDRGWS